MNATMLVEEVGVAVKPVVEGGKGVVVMDFNEQNETQVGESEFNSKYVKLLCTI
jgi:hypothetical protein